MAKAVGLVYPGSAHVHEYGCDAADDAAIWAYARDHGFTIVTKDSDYEQLSVMKGAPPKVIWLRTGNCTTEALSELFRRREADISSFLTSDTDAILEVR